MADTGWVPESCAPPPPPGPGVCPVCSGCAERTVATRRMPLCRSCRRTARQLARPLVPVVPVALCTTEPSRSGESPSLYWSVRRYKWHLPQHELHPLRLFLGAVFETFMSRHAACIAQPAGGPWDLVTHVPSSKGRAGAHPLASVAATSPLLPARHRALLRAVDLRLTHSAADVRGFVASPAACGARVLVVDDTYVSGSRAQSAAAALADAGAVVVGIVVLCRIVDPTFSQAHAAYWRACAGREIDVDTCCLEVPVRAADRAA